jgi:hypothetical protein
LAAEHFDCAASFGDAAHGDKGKAFGTLSATIDDDFGAMDGADTVE